jgi:hypothetical protein
MANGEREIEIAKKKEENEVLVNEELRVVRKRKEENRDATGELRIQGFRKK